MRTSCTSQQWEWSRRTCSSPLSSSGSSELLINLKYKHSVRASWRKSSHLLSWEWYIILGRNRLIIVQESSACFSRKWGVNISWMIAPLIRHDFMRIHLWLHSIRTQFLGRRRVLLSDAAFLTRLLGLCSSYRNSRDSVEKRSEAI